MMLFSLGELVSKAFIKSDVWFSLVAEGGLIQGGYYEILIPLLHMYLDMQ